MVNAKFWVFWKFPIFIICSSLVYGLFFPRWQIASTFCKKSSICIHLMHMFFVILDQELVVREDENAFFVYSKEISD